MKINIANPATGCQKLYEFDDERKVRVFFDKRMSSEVELDTLGDEFKGYVAKITGGNDKQGFPMMQGVLVNGRVRLLLDARHKCYRPRRKGERKRKSVRGCIVGPDMAVISVVIVKKGENELPGLTDKDQPQRLGPKRASKIRKLFNLEKEDDVRKYVVRRQLPQKEGKKLRTKAPKIQRLVTPRVLQHKRRLRALKVAHAQKTREDSAAYAKLLATRRQEAKSKRAALISAKRSEKASTKSASKKATPPVNEQKAPVSSPQVAQTAKLAKAATPKAKTGAAKPVAKIAKAKAAGTPVAKKVAVKKPAAKKAAVKPAAKKASA